MKITEVEIGLTAGKIWNYLAGSKDTSANTILNLKLELNMDNTMFFLALGWLYREGKIVFTENKNNYVVGLKKQ